jgi:hypothetical protein
VKFGGSPDLEEVIIDAVSNSVSIGSGNYVLRDQSQSFRRTRVVLPIAHAVLHVSHRARK